MTFEESKAWLTERFGSKPTGALADAANWMSMPTRSVVLEAEYDIDIKTMWLMLGRSLAHRDGVFLDDVTAWSFERVGGAVRLLVTCLDIKAKAA